MKPSKSLRQLIHLRPGDHLCFLYETDEEHRAVLTPFLRQGLECQDKILYLSDTRRAEVALVYLKDDGVEVGPYLASGQFSTFRGDARTLNIEEMVAFLRKESEKALEEGYRALRIAGEMAWVLRELPKAEAIIEYESGLDNFFPESPFLFLCLYDRRCFDPALLLEILAAHPFILVGTMVQYNIYYQPPRELLGGDLAAAKLTKWLNNLVEHQQVMEDLQKRTHDLGERVKELNCLFGIFSLVEIPEITLEEMLKRVVDLIPLSWQYPEITCARLILENREFRTMNFRETPWRQSSEIVSHGNRIGLLEVFYQEKRPDYDEGPFLKEERNLLNAIAGRVGSIAKRYFMEQALHLEKEKYQTLAEKSPMGISIISKDGRYKYLNPKFVEIFGYTLEDIPTGRAWYARAYPNPEYRQQAISKWIKDLQKSKVGEVRPSTFVVTCKDGTDKVIGFRPVSLQTGDQLVIYEDITERTRAEEALRQSENKYRTLVEQIPATTYIAFLDSYSSTIYVSPQIESMIGFSTSDFEADQDIWKKQLYPEDRERVLAEVARCHANGEPFVSEYRMLTRDGQVVWVRDEGWIVRDTAGQALFLQGVMLDITARRRAEEALKEQLDFLQTLIDTIPNPIFYKDASGNYSGCNRAFEKYIGLSKQDIIGKTVFNLAPPDLAAKYYEMDQALFRQPGEQFYEAAVRYADDSLHQVIFNKATFYKTDGNVGGLVGVMLDITKRKKAEEALKSSKEKLQFLTAQLLNTQENERKRLAAELHDELGHALLILKLQLESLEEQLLPQQISLKNEARQILRFILETIERVRRLYLDLSPGDLEDLGLTNALKSLIDDFVAPQKRISWNINLDNLEGLFPLPVQTAIYRVVQEALTNIGKHAQPQRVSLVIKHDQKRVSFTLEDDGKGFDKFEVLATKQTLGLLAMEERVKILGGSFELWSQKNRGTRISFSVPVSEGGNWNECI